MFYFYFVFSSLHIEQMMKVSTSLYGY